MEKLSLSWASAVTNHFLFFFFKTLNFYLYARLWVPMGDRGVGSLELKLQVVVSLQVLVLRIKPLEGWKALLTAEPPLCPTVFVSNSRGCLVCDEAAVWNHSFLQWLCSHTAL